MEYILNTSAVFEPGEEETTNQMEGGDAGDSGDRADGGEEGGMEPETGTEESPDPGTEPAESEPAEGAPAEGESQV